jgi:hypothetical protein
MLKWKRLGGKLVPPALAEKRAAICVKCPENVPIVGCFGCGAASKAIPAILKMIKGSTTNHDNDLKGCGVCGCQLRALVHLPSNIKEYGEEEIKEFPKTCWQRKEFES